MQTPTPDIFSFAKKSLFFAVIFQNEQLPRLPSSAGDSKSNEPLKDVELMRAMGGSPRVTYAQSLAGSSSSTLVPADGTSGRLSAASRSVCPEGEWHPGLFEQTARELKSHDWRSASPNSRTYETDVDISNASDQTLQSPGLNLRNDSVMNKLAYVHNPANKTASLSEIKHDFLCAVHAI
jgi:hypothetical protein